MNELDVKLSEQNVPFNTEPNLLLNNVHDSLPHSQIDL